jgi:hypothetical protein
MVEVYKAASNNNNQFVIVVLEFLSDTISISHSKFTGRGNKFFIKDIYDIKGNKYNYAKSRYVGVDDNIPKLKYIKNQIIIDKNFDKNLIERISGGIHFSNSLEDLFSSEYGLNFQLEFHSNDFIDLPNGKYKAYSDVIKNTWKHHLIGTYSVKNNKLHGDAYTYHYPSNYIQYKTIFSMGKIIYQEKYMYDKDYYYYKYYERNQYGTKFFNSNGTIKKSYITNDKTLKVE